MISFDHFNPESECNGNFAYRIFECDLMKIISDIVPSLIFKVSDIGTPLESISEFEIDTPQHDSMDVKTELNFEIGSALSETMGTKSDDELEIGAPLGETIGMEISDLDNSSIICKCLQEIFW
jgi:hypothetical protein